MIKSKNGIIEFVANSKAELISDLTVIMITLRKEKILKNSDLKFIIDKLIEYDEKEG